jgi:sensor histidine kinase YesM
MKIKMEKALVTLLVLAITNMALCNSFTTEILPATTELETALTIAADYQIEFDDPVNMTRANQSQWVRLVFENPTAENQVIWLDQPWLDHGWVYSYDELNVLIDSNYCGYDVPIKDRLLENQHLLLELAEGTKKVIVRMKSCESIFVNIRIKSLSQAVRSQSRLDIGFGIYSGLVFLSIIYGLIMFFVFRSRPWLFYSAYIFSVFFGQLISFGFDQITIYKGSINAIEPAALIVPFIVFTTRKLLIVLFDLELKERRIRRVLNVIALVALSSLIFRLFDFFELALTLSNISAFAMSIMIFHLAVTRVNQKTDYERQIIYAMMVFSIGAIIFNLKNLAILPTMFITEYAMIIGSCFDMLLLARAMYKKVEWAEEQRKNEYVDRIKLKTSTENDTKRIVELEIKLRSYMYKAIMNALNPHFLFNALNSVFRCVQLEDSKSAQEYLAKLSKIMRIVLQNSEFETVPIEHELNFLGEYMSLEKIRRKEMLQYEFIVDPQIDQRSTFIPTGIIQPLLENAVIHGINEDLGMSGKVFLTLDRVGDDLIIKVKDNGVGYHHSKKLKADKVRTHKSFALKLIRKRLELDYDETQYKIDIESQKNLGTTVTIKMPFPKPGNYNQFKADYF